MKKTFSNEKADTPADFSVTEFLGGAMELHVWPADFGLPSIDVKCLQFLFGRLRFVDMLRKSGQEVVIDAELTPSERSQIDAFNCFLQEYINPAVVVVEDDEQAIPE
ncbi:hypothetical protein TELCIR_14988 [Teladorsagia circumcincta]|uniref:Uncharacterized protein n=1 Tax=Teladorsagia circumcincta TaxID=45464 RepID=A0A2G9U1N2_TELCI|nr:hypothetical protein TELCIR_14988 [Teladorsagia circumcincta]